MISSRDNEKLKLVRKLHERRWRDKLGLFVCEGEDSSTAATAEPVELLVAGENVEARLLAEVSTAAHPPRVIGVYRRDDLPAPEPRPVDARALARRRSRERRHADPHGGRLRRRGRALGGLRRPDRAEGAARLGGLDLARAAAAVPERHASPARKRVALVARRRRAARRGRPARRGRVPARRRARGAAGRGRARRRGLDPDRRRRVAERRRRGRDRALRVARERRARGARCAFSAMRSSRLR